MISSHPLNQVVCAIHKDIDYRKRCTFYTMCLSKFRCRCFHSFSATRFPHEKKVFGETKVRPVV